MKSLPAFAVGAAVAFLLTVDWSAVPATAEVKGPARPPASENGDVNGDGVIDVADPVHLLHFLFLAGPAPVPVDCDEPPPPDTGCAEFRILNDVACDGQPLTANVQVCDQTASDLSGDVESSVCNEFCFDSSTCTVELDAFTAVCGPISVCGDIPVREGYVYDLVLIIEFGLPTILWMEQELDASGNCPVFPPPASFFPNGRVVGNFTPQCGAKRREVAGDPDLFAGEYSGGR